MLIESFKTESLGWNNVRLTWNGLAGKTVRVFLNGLLSFGPRAIATVDKSIVLSVPDPVIIEVHENDATETVGPVIQPLMRKPLVWWSSRDGAVEYRVYSRDQLLGVVRHNPSLLHHEFQVTQDLRQDGGTWTGLRVEAVSARGRESIRPEFPVYAPGILRAPFRVSVIGPPDNLTFTIGTRPLVPVVNESGQQMVNESGQPMFIEEPA